MNTLKLCLHKVKYWEFWPTYVVYMPTFFLWLWLMFKFRSLSFYKYANPTIKNGGLYGESKFDIYKLLPEGSFPKTVLVQTGYQNDFMKILAQNKLNFPLIVKPDIGDRGIAVQNVYAIADLELYSKSLKKNFLIQEIIEYPCEIGLFYCRMPNETNGKITGITLKKFLTIEGNGVDTMEQLLQKNPRFKIQIPKLRQNINLSTILPKSKKECLVPFGNHNRGTEFLDGKHYISQKLEQTFDNIFKNIAGFYYGRLDIRFDTLEKLERGENFSIIELNGAKSEPTHIYDPKYSFWYGQKEIFKHQKIFQRIIRDNMRAMS